MEPEPIEVQRLAYALAMNAGWTPSQWHTNNASEDASPIWKRAREIANG